MYIGRYRLDSSSPRYTARTYQKYDVMPTIPSGSTITAATQTFKLTSGTSTGAYASAYRVTGADWSSKTITWNNKPAAATSIAITGNNISQNGNHSELKLNMLNTVNAWYSGSTIGKNNNYGVMIRYQSETVSDYNAFYSADVATESSRPKLVISYNVVNGISTDTPYSEYISTGQENWYKFIPPFTGTYTFTTIGSTDTYGELYAGTTLLTSNNNNGEGVNFSINRNLTAGSVYNLKVRGYSASTSGSYTLWVVGNHNFNISFTPTLKTKFNMLLGSGKKSPLHYYTPAQCIDIILSYDSYITSVCNTANYVMPKALVQALLMRELWCVNESDIIADSLVMQYFDWKQDQEDWFNLPTYLQLITPFPVAPAPLLADSSTGIGQMFSATGISAHNNAINIGLSTSPTLSDAAWKDCRVMWYNLRDSDTYTCKMVHYEIFNCARKNSETSRFFYQYSSSKIKALLARYNGGGDEAVRYGNEVYEYYLLFNQYNKY